MSTSGKKLIIKPLRSRPRVPEDFESSTWERLRTAIEAIYNSAPTSFASEQLYRDVVDLCLHGESSNLYRRLKDKYDQHAAFVAQRLSEHASLDALAFLPHVLEAWKKYCSQLLLIRQIFLYLDRTYVLSETNHRSIFDMGLKLLEKHLNDYREVEGRVVEGTMALINAERSGEAVDGEMVRELLRMLGDLGLYERDFHSKFIHQSMKWYMNEGERLVQVGDVPHPCMYGRTDLLELRNRYGSIETQFNPSDSRWHGT